jgi:LmbE family N-acetylglucosaminyl deacetylase
MVYDQPLRLLVIGAHPDDAEYHAGGLISLYRKMGHVVKMISVTNGAAGHHARTSEEIVAIRRGEAQSAGNIVGTTYEVWEYPDGALQVTLELRHRMVREIRTFQPDLVLTHRTNDYHPDHRAVGQAVQDASFSVCVPLIVPESPALRRDPVVAYMPDMFTKPNPMTADVVIDIGGQMDTIIAMLACHCSQVFEWLPWLEGLLDQIPKDRKQRLAWLHQWYGNKIRPRADRYRSELITVFGHDRGKSIEFAEIYEISEYGSPLDAAARERLFSRLPY